MATTTQTVFTKAFWRGALERSFNTFWQTWLSVFGLGTTATITTGADILAQPWLAATYAALFATFLALVKSFVQPEFTAGTTASDSGVNVVPLVGTTKVEVPADVSPGVAVSAPSASPLADIAAAQVAASTSAA